MLLDQKLITKIRSATKITVLTGAGISAESGIPTFREAQTGMWARFDPMELATPEAFRINPQLVWEWYTWRRELIRRATPNEAHYAITTIENLVDDFTLITQNIDNLHTHAGTKNVIELHGNIFRVKCSKEFIPFDTWEDRPNAVPICPNCDAYLRPDVIWFNEALPAEGLQNAWVASENTEVFITIGTSAMVQPAATLPIVARQHGAILIEINPTQTPISHYMNMSLQMKASKALPMLIEEIWGMSK